MIKSKFLTDSAWKDVIAKNKGIKDNGLLKTLAEIKKLGDDDHEEAQDILDQIQKLAAQLKKDKTIAAVPAVGKFLADLSGAADTAVKDVAKAKAEYDKVQKTKTDAEKKAAAKKDSDEDDDNDEDEEDEEASELLTTKLKPLLKRVAKGERMHALLAKSGKRVVVLMSPKPISPSRRKLLAEELGGGSTKYYPGHCSLEAGAMTFVLKAEVAGMSKLVKAALLGQTGLRLNKVKCRGEDGDDNDEDEGEDDPALAEGDEDEDKGGDKAADAKVPSPALAGAPGVWDGARDVVQTSINVLKKAVQAQISEENDELIDQINGQLDKLDRILGRLDQRLSTSLANAGQAKTASGRNAALQESKTILAEYIRYITAEPLIAHLDSNPFGVSTDLKATLSKSLTQLARAIG